MTEGARMDLEKLTFRSLLAVIVGGIAVMTVMSWPGIKRYWRISRM